MKRDLQFVATGQLGAALAIDMDRAKSHSDEINAMMDRRTTLQEIIEVFNEKDLTDAEWTNLCFSLGYMNCAMGH